MIIQQIDKIDIIVKIWQSRCEHMSSQNQTEGFNQASIETPHRSPDLVVFRYFIGLDIICPNLA